MPEVMDYSMTRNMPAHFLGRHDIIINESQLMITEQPRKYLRYRYASEKKSTHGVLRGYSTISRSQETFPSIKLTVSPEHGNKEFYVLISLYKPPTLDENQGAAHVDEPKIFSPNLLAKKEAKIKKSKNKKLNNNNNSSSNNNNNYKNTNVERSSSEDEVDDECDYDASSAIQSTSMARGAGSSSGCKRPSRAAEARLQQSSEIKKGKNQQSNAKTAKESRKKFEMYQKPLVERMLRVDNKPLEFEYFLRDCFIIRTKKELKDEVIKQKYLELARWEKQGALTEAERDVVLQRYQADKEFDRPSNRQNFESVCLGFTVYWRDPLTHKFKHFIGPVLSSAIINGEALTIHKICNPRGNMLEETEVTLLVPEAKQNDIEVRIFELDKTEQGIDTRVWEHLVRESDLLIYKNVAITFKMPAYSGPKVKTHDDVSCYIMLRRPSDNNESSPVKFIYSRKDVYNNYYHPISNDGVQFVYVVEQYETSEEPEAKRVCYGYDEDNNFDATPYLNYLPTAAAGAGAGIAAAAALAPMALALSEERANEQGAVATVEAEPQTPTPGQAVPVGGCIQETEAFKNLKMAIVRLEACASEEDINKQLKEYNNETGKILFHDAVAMNVLHKLFPLFDKHTILSRQLRAAINEHKQTVLHYACRLDKAYQIRPLINQGCLLDAEDQQRHTPMHIAVNERKMECISVFCQLIADSASEAKYRHFRKQLKKVLNLYDTQNFTILHRAIMNGLESLVEVLLEFCKAEGIDAMNDYVVLGGGDTLLHLARAKNLHKMVRIICKHCPNAKSYQNYAGQLAIEDSSDSFADNRNSD